MLPSPHLRLPGLLPRALVAAVVAGVLASSLPLGHAGTAMADGEGPALTLFKSADPATFTEVGDRIDYTYELTNTGNVPLEGPFAVDDDKIDPGLVDCSSAPATLAVGASFNCSAGYIITETDFGLGWVMNRAIASAFYGTVRVDSNEDSTAVTRPGVPVPLPTDTPVPSPTPTPTPTASITPTPTPTASPSPTPSPSPSPSTSPSPSPSPSPTAGASPTPTPSAKPSPADPTPDPPAVDPVPSEPSILDAAPEVGTTLPGTTTPGRPGSPDGESMLLVVSLLAMVTIGLVVAARLGDRRLRVRR